MEFVDMKTELEEVKENAAASIQQSKGKEASYNNAEFMASASPMEIELMKSKGKGKGGNLSEHFHKYEEDCAFFLEQCKHEDDWRKSVSELKASQWVHNFAHLARKREYERMKEEVAAIKTEVKELKTEIAEMKDELQMLKRARQQ